MEYLKESDANIVQAKQKKSSKIKRKENEKHGHYMVERTWLPTLTR